MLKYYVALYRGSSRCLPAKFSVLFAGAVAAVNAPQRERVLVPPLPVEILIATRALPI